MLKVCYSCSDCGTQGLGQTRSVLGYFECQKAMRHTNIITEMRRLVDGFKANVRASRLESVVADTISTIKVPAWQMSEKWLVRTHYTNFFYFPIFPSRLWCTWFFLFPVQFSALSAATLSLFEFVWFY